MMQPPYDADDARQQEFEDEENERKRTEQRLVLLKSFVRDPDTLAEYLQMLEEKTRSLEHEVERLRSNRR